MRKFLMAKLVSILLIGTAWANVGQVSTLAQAIARTEGFYVKGTLPNRLHNPGDIRSTRRDAYPGQVGLNKNHYVVFRSDRWGWAALEAQIQKVVDGTSSIYTQEMTFAQIAKRYASSPQWPKTLCKIIGVTPATTFQEYFGIAPRVRLGAIHDYPVWASSGTPMPVLQPVPLL